jgi:ectoine hydroxylase-related dioxygenase (phytanoyl-CoA dioxygenase family)
MGQQVQGVLNLIDNRCEDGGFQCVPMGDPCGWLRGWCPTQHWTSPPEPNGRYIFSPKAYECLGPRAVRVPCPAGSLLLFDACLPHGTLPNRSGRPRAIQFLRYLPRDVLSDKCLHARAAAVRRHCRLLGFAPTPEEAAVLF